MVYLDDYYIDVYEVTNALYAECVAAGKCDPPASNASYKRSSYYDDPAFADYPVIYVTWNMALAYCEWRGGSLSTEAQWEKAARGRLEGMDYPWGNEAPVCQKGAPNGAKFDDDAGCNDTGTEPVGSYSANGYGLFDMAGNVWEWVWDWYSSYSSSSARNPTGPESGSSKVTRCGSWYRIDVRSLRVAYRNSYVPDDRYDDIGFRCARSP
jgi:formylglycine-generating enzyme required for sulfatase activity